MKLNISDLSVFYPITSILGFLFLILVFQLAFSMEKEEPRKPESKLKKLIKNTVNAKNKEKKTAEKNEKAEQRALEKIPIKELKTKSLSLWKLLTKQHQDVRFPVAETLWILPDEITLKIARMLIDRKDLKKSAQAILNFASASKASHKFFNDPSVMIELLQSVPTDHALSLAAQMKKMRVMRCQEVKNWRKDTTARLNEKYRNENEKIENSKKLFELVKKRNIGEIQILLKNKNIDLNWIDTTSGINILMEAAKTNNKDIVKTLIATGANVNGQNASGYAPIFLGNIFVRKILLNAGADLNIANSFGCTPLQYAVFHEEIEITKLFLAYGATINSTDNRGRTAIWYSVKNTELVKILLAAGADPKITKDILAQAARFSNDAEVIISLVNAGADVDGEHTLGFTALMFAAERDKQEMVKMLLDAHATVNKIDTYGDNAFIKACGKGHTNIVRMLIDAGAAVNHVDHEGKTALIKACMYGYTEIVRMLVDAGADISYKDDIEWDALMYAQNQENAEIIEMLQQVQNERQNR